MASLFKKAQKIEGLSSLVISPKGVALVYLSDVFARPLKCQIADFLICEDSSLVEKCIADIVATNNLAGVDCNWVLHPSQYRLLLVDLPKVPAEEYKSAVRWQIKEMIDFSVDDLIVEVFLPSSNIAEQQKKLYVIAVRKSFVQQMINGIRNCQLNLISIDIPEFAVRNLLSVISPEDQFGAFIQILDTSTVLTVVKNKEIYFTRHIMQGFNKVINSSAVDGFVTEIKKSFDYCQRQLKQDLTGGKVYVTPIMHNQDEALRKLVEVLGIAVEVIDINRYLAPGRELSMELQEQCYIAFGGALREEVQ